MQIRMGGRLTLSIEVGEALRQASMPPLLLQPLVENAVHHGIGPRLEGGHVHIGAVVRHGLLEIVVEDDGVGLGQARRSAGNGVALMNIRARLDTGFGARAALDIAPLAQGTRATLRLPFKPTFEKAT
jgi:LytS/YehU family sensor histidine kinase